MSEVKNFMTQNNTNLYSKLNQNQNSLFRGFAKNFFSQKIRDYYESGWVGPGLTRIFFF